MGGQAAAGVAAKVPTDGDVVGQQKRERLVRLLAVTLKVGQIHAQRAEVAKE